MVYFVFIFFVRTKSVAPLAAFMKKDDNLGLDINAIYFSENKSQSRKIRRDLEKSIRSVRSTMRIWRRDKDEMQNDI